MKAYERFLEYVAVWTTSDENSDTVPSAARELDLAKILVEEMARAMYMVLFLLHRDVRTKQLWD